ncbi:tetratricopeptide repeat protein [Rheinheimera salexigens]|uniref:Tetratricopeptide repeat protein n=1 Tax=Rheinheimera salexigens TaxID=1628148 RepID=A0A1E7Q8M3_9GAMM|nr:tetratricopeptide repeat protein [Rheinheimera salexigens]OEY70496.1 hypothetical protein BI198_13675 [Rheinheimera salexigens]
MRRINYSLLLLALLLSTACSQQPTAIKPATATDSVSIGTNAAALPKVAKSLPGSEQQQFTQAKQLMQQQDFDNAAELLQNIVASQADFAGVWYNLAVCQWQLNQAGEAESSLQQALVADAKSASLNQSAGLNLSASLNQNGSLNKSASLNLLGILAREQGQFGQAEQYWLQAVQANDTAAAHKNLGILYELYLGQLNQAQRHYQRYFELSQDPQAKMWLTLIDRQLAAQGSSDAEESL